jgi:hypothetical protein
MTGVSHAALIMAYNSALGRACRFNGTNEYMSRTATASIPSPQNRKNTFSFWIRPDSSGAGTFRPIFSANGGPLYGFLAINTLDQILYRQDDSVATIDVNAASTFTVDHDVWQHIVVQYDSTQGTAANRIKMFKDGSGGNASGSMPGANAAIFLGVITWPHYIGHESGGSYYLGDMAFFYWVDGAIHASTDFADTIDGTYQAKLASPTYNNNGIYIDMQSPNDLGNDVANGRDYALTNIDSSNLVGDGPPVSF